MTIRLRADEKAAVTSALEAEYDDEAQAAQAVFALCFDLLSKRPSHVVYVAWGPGVLYGPFGNKTDAKMASKLAAATFAPDALEGAVRVLPLGAPDSLSGANVGTVSGIDGRYCQADGCGHAWIAHINTKWSKPGAKSNFFTEQPGCTVTGCKCKIQDKKEVA